MPVSAERRLLRKGDFANLRKVTPGRVSQWIKAGQISGAALVIDGGKELIDVNIACEQLGLTLDPVQLSAQMRPLAPTAGAAPSPAPDQPPLLNDSQQRHQRVKVEQAEIALRQAQREEEAQRGTYIRTEDARREFAKTLTDLMASIEELMPVLGDALATDLKIDGKAATVTLRRELRAWRSRQSAVIKQAVESEPRLVDEHKDGGEGAAGEDDGGR